jgi:transposase
MNTEERNARRATLLKDFHESGLTQKAFCERHGLPISTLQYWLGRERKKTWARRPSDIVSVGTVDTVSGRQMLRVTSGIGVVIEVERPVSEAELAAIIRALRPA